MATKPLSEHSKAGLKLAAFTADDAGGLDDVTKAWIWATYSF